MFRGETENGRSPGSGRVGQTKEQGSVRNVLRSGESPSVEVWLLFPRWSIFLATSVQVLYVGVGTFLIAAFAILWVLLAIVGRLFRQPA